MKFLYTSLFASALFMAPFILIQEMDRTAQSQDSKGAAREDARKADKDEEPAKPELAEDSLYKLKVNDLDGKEVDLGTYQGKVTLVVNVASRCGYTPQYEGLQKLYDELKDKDFVVLGFPSNDFGKQEPGTADDIKKFCTDNYDVTFPLFEKLQTKEGDGQSPIYANLKKQSDSLPNWNFCKYLVGKDGKVIKFYNSKTTPDNEDLRKEIDAALAAEDKADEPKKEDSDETGKEDGGK
jgi:glutathione peroxidase